MDLTIDMVENTLWAPGKSAAKKSAGKGARDGHAKRTGRQSTGEAGASEAGPAPNGPNAAESEPGAASDEAQARAADGASSPEPASASAPASAASRETRRENELCGLDALRALRDAGTTSSPSDGAQSAGRSFSFPSPAQAAPSQSFPVAGDAPDGSPTADLSEALAACEHFVFHPADEPDAWTAYGLPWAKFAQVTVRPVAGSRHVRVEMDTGVRVGPSRVRQANLFAMMVNGILRVRGFQRIARDGRVVFAFTSTADDADALDQRICLGLASVEDAARHFTAISHGASARAAFGSFTGEREAEDEDFSIAFDADFDAAPHDPTDDE